MMDRAERYNQFEKDMKGAGFKVIDYEGRLFFHGPAVRCRGDDQDSELPTVQDVIRATKLVVQHDNLGLGFVVYPR